MRCVRIHGDGSRRIRTDMEFNISFIEDEALWYAYYFTAAPFCNACERRRVLLGAGGAL